MAKTILLLDSGSNNKNINNSDAQKNITFNLYWLINKVKRYPISRKMAITIHSKISNPLNISFLVKLPM